MSSSDIERWNVIAAQSAREAGLSNLETRIMDGENLELPQKSSDAVICRFALMFFDHPLLGLEGVRRVLKPGGRLGDPEFLTALSTVQKYLEFEQQAKPAATSLGTPEVLEQPFTAAGFLDVEVHPLTLQVRMASAAECVRYLQDTSPTLREIRLPVSPEARMDAWQKVEDSLSKYENPSGFEVHHLVLLAAGSA